ncbi:aminotransferase class V-fold PLP-dependent enzyme [Prevotella sp. E15-22]|uniref:trans-sulfuration enzyme family protein n=1 Tax=Prevotella sp. E15-22 TaxID=2937774 RepID=UPI002049C57E|nr:aminotransferase class V-fold PLP-dependent enzyme [Prevotella sp. E15-22]UPS44458.1 aminotransferase class V-fold PLP-dependent enzyme [Prevotella sp. E15-22]
MNKQTIAINNPYVRPDVYGALAVPVYNNVAFEFEDAAEMADAFCNRIKAPDYARVENPTVTNFEQRVKALTGADHVTAFNSGMAAISNTLLAVSEQGKNIVSSRHLFGNTLALITTTLKRFGVEPRLRDLTNVEAVAKAIDDKTCAVFLEVVTNPQLEVANLKAIAEIAHSKGVPVIADSTVIPFTETNLKTLGVDVEVVSSTKYLSGGGTSLGGLVIDYGTFPEINKRLKYELLFNLGAYMTPQAAYMQTLGLETLDVRYQRQASNALWLAQELSKVVKVNYVGLDSNPYHALAQQQFGPTAGAMFTIDLDSKEACFRFLNRLKLVHRATNLFDSRTLAIHPASTIFGNFPEAQLNEMDVHQTTIRLSIGLEDKEDILADIKQALA